MDGVRESDESVLTVGFNVDDDSDDHKPEHYSRQIYLNLYKPFKHVDFKNVYMYRERVIVY